MKYTFKEAIHDFAPLFWFAAVVAFIVAWLESANDPDMAGFIFLLSLIYAMIGLFGVYPDKKPPKD